MSLVGCHGNVVDENFRVTGSSQQAAQRFEVGRRIEEDSDRDAEARDDAAVDLSGTGLQQQTKDTCFEHVLFDGLGLRIDDPILTDAVSLVVRGVISRSRSHNIHGRVTPRGRSRLC